jgi:DNA repair exonuclease SbcCD ATPase subunit
MGDVRDSMRNFLRELNKILEENKSLIEKSKKINSVREKLDKVSENREKEKDIEKSVEDYDKQAVKLNEEVISKQKQIKDIENSEEFSDVKKQEEELEGKRKQLDNLFLQLKSLIDFKALANFYHSFEKEMSEVKKYRDNFRKSFEKNPGSVLSLLQEANLSKEEIKDKINEIKELQEKIKNTEIRDSGIGRIEKSISLLKLKTEELKTKKAAGEKRKNKLEQETSGIKGQIMKELKEINVEIS